MAISNIGGVRISGIHTVVPKHYRLIEDEVDLYGGDADQIRRLQKSIGLHKRHVVEYESTTSDLCVEAARRLLTELNLPLNSVDGLIAVTQTPDHFQPGNACITHGKLGLDNSCASFDVNLGCSGYVYGLWLAHMMVASGTCSNVLLLTGDTISRQVNPRDRAIAPLFGDAGSATLLKADDRAGPAWFSLNSDGTGAEFIQVPAGGFRTKSAPETAIESETADGNIRSPDNLYMSGGDVFNFTIKVVPKTIEAILSHSQISRDDIDYFILHQANRYIITNIARRMKVPIEKVPCDTVEAFGNQSSASIPATICNSLAGRNPSLKKLVLCGYGVGLSWASCIIDFQPEQVNAITYMDA